MRNCLLLLLSGFLIPALPALAATDNPFDVEARVLEVSKKAVACTVGLQRGRQIFGSGVVISSDGYILTAGHVTGGPGESIRVTFSDGQVQHGRSLGWNPDVDGALIKLHSNGPFEFAELATASQEPDIGDWCVASGHPGSYHPGRTPPIRLGRVIFRSSILVRTDCTIESGDSGGPLFDLDGRIIGIHSRIAESLTLNLHVPVATFRDTLRQMKQGETTRMTPVSRFLGKFDFDGDGSVVRSEIPEGVYQRVYDRLVKKFALDPSQPIRISELRTDIGLNVVPPPKFVRVGLMPRRLGNDALEGPTLEAARFTRGSRVLTSVEDSAAPGRAYVVRVLRKGKQVALGTRVSADGLFVTKASRVIRDRKQPLEIRLNSGDRVPAELIAKDSSWDLALLRANVPNTAAPIWADQPIVSGQVVVSQGISKRPVSVGVVSVLQRRISRKPPAMGVLLDFFPKPNSSVVRPGIKNVFQGSGADLAGFLSGDVILKVEKEYTGTIQSVQRAIAARRAGDIVEMLIERDGKEMPIEVELGAREDTIDDNGGLDLTGPLSRRRDDFPNAFQHDSVLRPQDCGGPLVDGEGRLVGVNIARATRTATLALRPDVIRGFVARARNTVQGFSSGVVVP